MGGEKALRYKSIGKVGIQKYVSAAGSSERRTPIAGAVDFLADTYAIESSQGSWTRVVPGGLKLKQGCYLIGRKTLDDGAIELTFTPIDLRTYNEQLPEGAYGLKVDGNAEEIMERRQIMEEAGENDLIMEIYVNFTDTKERRGQRIHAGGYFGADLSNLAYIVRGSRQVKA